MQAARRFFLKQLTWLGLLSVGGASLAAAEPALILEESPYLDIDEMYDETDELYGMDGWL